MPKLDSCRGLAAVVTGASSGIGLALARRLARDGARVALVARRVGELEAVAAEIVRGGGEAVALPCDVADRDQVRASAEEALRHFGAIDLLVNNAGYGHHRRFLDWDIDDIERLMRVNYLGSVYWTKALLPQMLERRRGWVVFVASVAGKIGVPEETAYVASKFAIVGLAEALSFEVEEGGVHVLTVCPGTVRTNFFDQEALERMPPVARRSMIEAEQLADAIIRALRAGKRDITVPRSIGAAYFLRAIAPGLLRHGIRRTTLGAQRGPAAAC